MTPSPFLWSSDGHTRIPCASRAVTIERSAERILAAVAAHFGMTPRMVRQKSNTAAVVIPRQIAAYLMHKHTQASLPTIGRLLGGQHHTTVLHSIRKIERQVQTDPEMAATVQAIRAELEGGV